MFFMLWFNWVSTQWSHFVSFGRFVELLDFPLGGKNTAKKKFSKMFWVNTPAPPKGLTTIQKCSKTHNTQQLNNSEHNEAIKAAPLRMISSLNLFDC